MEQSEIGSYILLLCYQWSNGSIPSDKTRLARVAGGPVTSHVLAKFKQGPDGKLRNERLELEREKQRLYKEACSEGGKKGGGNPKFKKGEPNPYYKDNSKITPEITPEITPPLPEAHKKITPDGAKSTNSPKAQQNDMFLDKGGLSPTLSFGDKGKINTPSPSPSPSPDPDLQSPSPSSRVRVRVRAARFAPPDVEEVKSYSLEINLPETEGFKFHAYYESNGWRVGKNPMQNWKSALQNWKRGFEEKRYERHPATHSNGRQQIKPVAGSAPNNGF